MKACRQNEETPIQLTPIRIGSTPAVAAGVEFERWDLERVVEMTADFMRRKQDAEFEKAFAEAGI